MRLEKTKGTVCALAHARPWLDPTGHFCGTFGFRMEACLCARELPPEPAVGDR